MDPGKRNTGKFKSIGVYSINYFFMLALDNLVLMRRALLKVGLSGAQPENSNTVYLLGFISFKPNLDTI
jgi:hypothetical protein